MIIAAFSSSYCGAHPIKPDPPAYVAPNLDFDVLHTVLNLDLDLAGGSIAGEVSHSLIPLRSGTRSIRLNAVDIEIEKVFIDGSEVDFDYPVPGGHETSWLEKAPITDADDHLVVHGSAPFAPGKPLELKIVYKCKPAQGLYFIAPEKGLPSQRYEVWSQGEGEDNRFWIPCFDYPNDKATFEGIFRVKKGFYVLSNGVLKSKKDLGDKTEYHWHLDTPQSSYLIMMAAGKYDVIRDHWQDVELLYIVPPGTKKSVVDSAFGLTPDMIGFFSRTTGIRYPFKKYGQVVVQNFLYGGMENTTATVMNKRLLRDEKSLMTRTSRGLVAHELAHMWWGDMVTCREWTQMWLNEGFATYFQSLYEEYHSGDDAFRYRMDEIHRGVVKRDQMDPRPVVVDFFNRRDERNSSNVYIKGASFLHMLRFVLGDTLFFAAVKEYGTERKYRSAETRDLEAAVRKVSGFNLEWLFEQWLYCAGHPEYEVSSSYDGGTELLHLSVIQKQKTGDLVPVFRMPVDIEITCENEKKLYRIMVDKVSQEYYFKTESKPDMVIFDKGDWILKTLDFNKSIQELAFQLKNGEAIERIRAAKSLGAKGHASEVVPELERALLGDEFWGVQREAAYSLAKIKSAAAVKAVLKGMESGNPKVRLACVESLGRMEKTGRIEKLLISIFKNEASYEIRAAALNDLVELRSEKAAELCLAALSIDSHEELIRNAGIAGLKKLEVTSALKKIGVLAAPGNERKYRHEAISAYAALAKKLENPKNREKASKFLSAMLDDWYIRTRTAAAAALADLGEESALRALDRTSVSDPSEIVRTRAKRAAAKIKARNSNKKSDEELIADTKELKEKIEYLEKKLRKLELKTGASINKSGSKSVDH